VRLWACSRAGRPSGGLRNQHSRPEEAIEAFPNPLEKLKALLGGGSPPPPPQQLPVQPAAVYPPMQAQLPVQQAPAAPPQEVPQELPQEVPQEVPTDMGGDADDSGDLPGAAAGAATGAGQASQASAGTPPAPGAYCTEPAPPASSQCGSLDECLTIIDRFLDSQPRAFNLLQVRSEDHLEQDLPGPCPEGPAKCRHDTYDSALAALYYVKRGKLSEAREILDAFLGIMYPASLDGFKPPSGETRYTGVASGKTLTLLASSYNSANPPQGGVYENPDVTDGGVDTGNNAWAALAFAHYAAAANAPCYATAARDIIGALQQHSCSDSLQGFMGHLPPYPAMYRSAEHNIDMFGLGKVMGDQAVQNSAGSFVRGMFGVNPTFPTTYATGTGDGGRCDPSIAPGFPVAVDATFWNVLADADPTQANIDSALKFALQSPGPGQNGHPDETGLWVTDVDEYAPDGSRPSLSGVRFSTSGNGGQWENTAGAVMAMAHYMQTYGKDAFPDLAHCVEAARGSMKTLLKMYNGIPSSVLGGTYVAWQQFKDGADVSPPGGSDTGLGWPYLRYTATAPTAWAGLMLLHQFDATSPVDENANPYARPTSAVPTGSDSSCMLGVR